MDGMEAGVIDTPELEAPEEVEEELGNADGGLEEQTETETPENPEAAEASEFTTKFGREYRAWLNGLKQTNPEAAKFIKQARDDYGRAFAIQQIDKRGIDGIRERHALLDSLTHGDAKGTEAITAMQERLAEAQEVDSLLEQGDPRALETLGEQFNPGLAKLAPAILDRVSKTDPAAFDAAILPHVMSTIQKSDALTQFNYLIDIFNGKYGKLDGQTLYARTTECLGKMGEAFNALEAKAGEAKTPPPVNKTQTDADEKLARAERIEQDSHWKSNIQSQTDPYANAKFEELFKPSNMRLKLDSTAKADLRSAWLGATTKAMSADPDYQRQMKLYRSQKNPDAAAVTNYVKNAINKHSKTAMESLVKARYGSFLAGKPRTQQVVKPGGKPLGAVGPNVEVRTVKPANDDIDFQKTGRDGVWNNRFVLKNGKTVQVRPA